MPHNFFKSWNVSSESDLRDDLAQGGNCLEGEATVPGRTVSW